jgi:hypothetical protein
MRREATRPPTDPAAGDRGCTATPEPAPGEEPPGCTLIDELLTGSGAAPHALL